MGYHSLCYVSLDSKLADFERKCGIVRRWNRTDREYIEAKKAFLTEKQEQLHSCLWAAVVKRHAVSSTDESEVCRYILLLLHII